MADEPKICPVCKKSASLTCGACKSISYCGKEHQKRHWNLHKLECRFFDIKKSSELGRYIVSNRDLPKETTIISESPLAVGPKISGAVPQCLGCYQPVDPSDEKTPRCPRCHWPICSNVCYGVINRDHHLPECLVLCNNLDLADNNNLMYEAIFPLRCLLLQKKNPKKWQRLLSLESHVEKRKQDKSIYGEVGKIASYICDNLLSRLQEGCLPDMTKQIVHFICGVIDVNSLEIITGRGEIYALYASASLMEHNCLPNTKHYFKMDDFKINVLSASDITKGEALSTMYTHVLWGTAARREHLKATKYFVCECKRCSDPTELGTHFSSLRCISFKPDDVTVPCGGLILPASSAEGADWKCDSCPLVLTASHVDDLMSRISQDVDNAMENPTVSKLMKFLTKLEKLLYKNHYHCFMIKHSLLQLYGRDPGFRLDELTEEQLQKKIDWCEELMGIVNVIDPGHGRVGLYSSVIQIELHAVLVEKSRRCDVKEDENKLLLEAKAQLDACMTDLSNEPAFSPGSSMLRVARNHIIEIVRKLKQNSQMSST